MVSRGAMAYNPAREVKSEPIRRSTGKTPLPSLRSKCAAFDSFDPSRLIDLRDRAFIGLMAYTFAACRQPITRGECSRMVKRRLRRAGLPPLFSNHVLERRA